MTAPAATPRPTASLLVDLSNEADLCRNETATDIAELLDEAVDEINRLLRALSEEKQSAECWRVAREQGLVSDEIAQKVNWVIGQRPEAK